MAVSIAFAINTEFIIFRSPIRSVLWRGAGYGGPRAAAPQRTCKCFILSVNRGVGRKRKQTMAGKQEGMVYLCGARGDRGEETETGGVLWDDTSRGICGRVGPLVTH